MPFQRLHLISLIKWNDTLQKGQFSTFNQLLKKKKKEKVIQHFFLPNLHQPLTLIRKLSAHGGQATRCYSMVRWRFFPISFYRWGCGEKKKKTHWWDIPTSYPHWRQPAGKVSVFTQTHWYAVVEMGRGLGVGDCWGRMWRIPSV